MTSLLWKITRKFTKKETWGSLSFFSLQKIWTGTRPKIFRYFWASVFYSFVSQWVDIITPPPSLYPLLFSRRWHCKVPSCVSREFHMKQAFDLPAPDEELHSTPEAFLVLDSSSSTSLIIPKLTYIGLLHVTKQNTHSVTVFSSLAFMYK